MNSIVDNFIERLNEDQQCDFCIYNDECSGGITPDGGGSPIYPPCDDIDDCLDIERIKEVLDKAERRFVMYDYDEYLEQKEEEFNEAVGAVLDTMNEKKEDNVLLNVGITKEWLLQSVKQIIQEYAHEQVKDVKQEAIASMRKELIDNKFDDILEQELRHSIKEKTDSLMDDFLDRKITISTGYWNEHDEIPVRQYIEDKVEKWIQKESNKSLQNVTDNLVDYKIKRTISEFSDSLKKDLNSKINDMFNQTTRNALSESMFNLLTQSESYRNVKNSLNNLLEDKHE